jgi:hypothetical protein
MMGKSDVFNPSPQSSPHFWGEEVEKTGCQKKRFSTFKSFSFAKKLPNTDKLKHIFSFPSLDGRGWGRVKIPQSE